MAYLIYRYKLDVHSALDVIRREYQFAEPNLDFLIQLSQFYQQVSYEESTTSEAIDQARKFTSLRVPQRSVTQELAESTKNEVGSMDLEDPNTGNSPTLTPSTGYSLDTPPYKFKS